METPTIEYFFQIQQLLQFNVFDFDGPGDHEPLGEVQINLGEIISKGTPILDLKLRKKPAGKLVVRVEEVKQSNQDVFFKIRADKVDKKDTFGKSDPYLVFYRLSTNGQWLKVFTTSVIKNTLYPVWPPININVQVLANGDFERPLKIECWDWDKHSKDDFIGVVQTCLSELIQPNFQAPLINPKKQAKKKKKYQNSGVLRVEDAILRKYWTFIDYLRGGTEFSLMVAIDFTASNGESTNTNSLHYLSTNMQNEYERAIMSIGSILENYDSNKLYPLYGFGGVPKGELQTNHCFPLTGDRSNPCVLGVGGLIQAYHYSLSTIGLSGPTLFQGVLQTAINVAAQTPPAAVYHVLLILTDGEIHDMNETKQLVVAGSSLPLSIIIIGLGSANFSNMRALDSDQTLLRDNSGRTAIRDIVQFVPFRDFHGNPHLLSKQVLAQLPKQLTDYMKSIRHEPMLPE